MQSNLRRYPAAEKAKSVSLNHSSIPRLSPIHRPHTQNSRALHVAIISDGNGRWAHEGLPRSAGHRQGAETARSVIAAAPSSASTR